MYYLHFMCKMYIKHYHTIQRAQRYMQNVNWIKSRFLFFFWNALRNFYLTKYCHQLHLSSRTFRLNNLFAHISKNKKEQFRIVIPKYL